MWHSHFDERRKLRCSRMHRYSGRLHLVAWVWLPAFGCCATITLHQAAQLVGSRTIHHFALISVQEDHHVYHGIQDLRETIVPWDLMLATAAPSLNPRLFFYTSSNVVDEIAKENAKKSGRIFCAISSLYDDKNHYRLSGSRFDSRTYT